MAAASPWSLTDVEAAVQYGLQAFSERRNEAPRSIVPRSNRVDAEAVPVVTAEAADDVLLEQDRLASGRTVQAGAAPGRRGSTDSSSSSAADGPVAGMSAGVVAPATPAGIPYFQNKVCCLYCNPDVNAINSKRPRGVCKDLPSLALHHKYHHNDLPAPTYLRRYLTASRSAAHSRAVKQQVRELAAAEGLKVQVRGRLEQPMKCPLCVAANEPPPASGTKKRNWFYSFHAAAQHWRVHHPQDKLPEQFSNQRRTLFVRPPAVSPQTSGAPVVASAMDKIAAASAVGAGSVAVVVGGAVTAPSAPLDDGTDVVSRLEAKKPDDEPEVDEAAPKSCKACPIQGCGYITNSITRALEHYRSKHDIGRSSDRLVKRPSITPISPADDASQARDDTSKPDEDNAPDTETGSEEVQEEEETESQPMEDGSRETVLPFDFSRWLDVMPRTAQGVVLPTNADGEIDLLSLHRCWEPNCYTYCINYATLHQHCVDAHGYFLPETYTFSSRTELDHFLDRAVGPDLVRVSGGVNRQMVYQCPLNGFPRKQAWRGRRRQHSKKLGNCCPARLVTNTTFKDNRAVGFKVIVYTGHSNHHEIVHDPPLSAEVRRYICGRMLQGVSSYAIFRDLQSDPTQGGTITLSQIMRLRRTRRELQVIVDQERDVDANRGAGAGDSSAVIAGAAVIIPPGRNGGDRASWHTHPPADDTPSDPAAHREAQWEADASHLDIDTAGQPARTAAQDLPSEDEDGEPALAQKRKPEASGNDRSVRRRTDTDE